MWRQQKVASTYLIVSVEGESIARFLNMCRHRGIMLWDINRKEYGFDAKITRKDFLQLKEPCRKTKTRVRIRKRKGLRFMIFKYRKHYSFAIGIVLSFVLLYFCSQYIWDISFDGNSEYTDYSLLKYLETYEVKPGTAISRIDCNQIESELRNQYDDITWVSAEISGTRLIIHIKENDGATDENAATDATRDIVATQDGIVASIVTRTGTPLVKVGDTVTKGQILVSGVVDVCNDSKEVIGQKLTCADADIMLNVYLPYSDYLNITYEYKQYTNRKKVKNIFCINDTEIEYGIMLGEFEECDIITESSVWKLTGNFYLPIKSGTKTYLEYTMEKAEYTETEAEEILSERLLTYLREMRENKVQILDNGVKMETDGISYQYKGVLYLCMPAYEYAELTYTPIEMQNEEVEEE